MEVRICSRCHQVRPGGTTCPGCSGPLTLADESLFIGESFGKYRVESVLGTGGMGVVYRATHATLKRPAAVKIVMPQLQDEMFAKRFLREAQVLAELKHPSIVEIYDFDLSDWGTPYYVMECLEGAPLRSLLREGTALPIALLAPVLEGPGAGLAFAHRKGVVHRDLKPDNLFIAVYDGVATTKLLDFGIAKVLSVPDASNTLTATGTVMGTPNYLAPEQLLNQEIGPYTDQYGLALTIAELLAGKPIRAGKTLGEIIGVEIQRPLAVEQLPPELPAPLLGALRRATQPDPAKRFPDVTAFLAALELPAAEHAARALAERVQALPKRRVVTSPASGATPAQEAPTSPLVETTRVGPSPQRTPTVGLSTAGLVLMETTPVAARRARNRLGIAVALLALAAGVALLVQLRRHGAGPLSSRPVALEARDALPIRQTLAIPPDVTALLGRTGDALMLQGSNALYLLLENGSQAATRIPLGADEELLDSPDDGIVWKRSGSRLLRAHLAQHQEPVWIQKLPALDPWPGDSGESRLRISREGNALAVVQPTQIEVYEVAGLAAKRRFSIPWTGKRPPRLALGKRLLVAAQESKELAAYDLADGRRVWSAPYAEERIFAIALLEERRQLAVGGWFDHVDVFEMKPGGTEQRIPRPGETHSLAWLPDLPTLLMGGKRGLALWRPGQPAPTAIGAIRGAQQIWYAGSLLAVLDGERHTLTLHDYAGLTAPRRVQLSKASLWALAADPGTGLLFAGDSSGTLFSLRAGEDKPQSLSLHGAGITDLQLRGELLASTSDDKTIAVWQLPKMNVVWRSKAHGFLVNQLFLQGDPPSLWSASSDGTVKRWDWPQLEGRESLDSQQLLGRRVSLQSLWVSPAGDLALAGSWEKGLLRLRQSAGRWRADLLPVTSGGLYRCAGLEQLGAVLFTGIHPFGVWLYDLRDGRLHRLPDFDLRLYSVAPLPDGLGAIAVGEGALLRYEFERGEGDAIRVRARVQLHTGLGSMVAAVPTRGGIAAGNESGALLFIDAKFPGLPLVEMTLPVARP